MPSVLTRVRLAENERFTATSATRTESQRPYFLESSTQRPSDWGERRWETMTDGKIG